MTGKKINELDIGDITFQIIGILAGIVSLMKLNKQTECEYQFDRNTCEFIIDNRICTPKLFALGMFIGFMYGYCFIYEILSQIKLASITMPTLIGLIIIRTFLNLDIVLLNILFGIILINITLPTILDTIYYGSYNNGIELFILINAIILIALLSHYFDK